MRTTPIAPSCPVATPREDEAGRFPLAPSATHTRVPMCAKTGKALDHPCGRSSRKNRKPPNSMNGRPPTRKCATQAPAKRSPKKTLLTNHLRRTGRVISRQPVRVKRTPERSRSRGLESQLQTGLCFSPSTLASDRRDLSNVRSRDPTGRLLRPFPKCFQEHRREKAVPP